jgi:hypothetical protein
VPEPVRHDAAALNNDQLLQALEVGDVVLSYGASRPPPGLASLANEVAGRFSPSLAAAGQAVILDHRPDTKGVVGLAWTRMVHVASPQDPALRQFVQGFLGRGAGSH